MTLKEITYPFSQDLDVLLVGPQGQSIVLLSNVGPSTGTQNASNVTLTFSDAAASTIPQSTPLGSAGSSVTTKPVDYSGRTRISSPPRRRAVPTGTRPLRAAPRSAAPSTGPTRTAHGASMPLPLARVTGPALSPATGVSTSQFRLRPFRLAPQPPRQESPATPTPPAHRRRRHCPSRTPSTVPRPPARAR